MTDHAKALETFLQQMYVDIENKINEMITDTNILYVLSGGKRLRPLLSAIAYKVCTEGNEEPKRYQKFLEGSVVVELAHGASLIHDDIIDGDLNRRGEPAFYLKAGIDTAILTGHKMLVIGFDLALSSGDRIAKLYLETWRETLEGQLNEINFNSKDLNNSSISAESKFFQVYSKIIDMKTATLFSSACKVAAIWADASDDLADILGKYGREVGFAYQLADDLVDLEKGEMIDSVVIPLLAKLEKKSIKNGTLTARKIKKKIEKNSPEIKKLYIDEITKHINNSQELCQNPIIPNNLYKMYLEKAPSHIINRMLQEINIQI
ncbi:MAG: polyprenyl synthetase family protein [Candidatus Thermoplasmatota archaeon]|nr:polyprenyl synthetase family protein [Candidatus Thermoplasmatota archaeon]